MGRIVLAAALLLSSASVSRAQRAAAGGIPSDVAGAIAALYNAPQTQRERGAVDIAHDSVVNGSLAVRGGPVKIAGRVAGSLVVINADLTFLPGARVDSQVYVVGGTVEGRDQASIGGDFRSYSEVLRYKLAGEDLVVDDDIMARDARARDAKFWGQERDAGDRTRFDVFTVAGNNAYNRVEGFPIFIGPRIRLQRDWGSLSVQARAIVRTAEPMTWDRTTLGHDARFEFRWGSKGGIGVGATAFDRVDPIESWYMSDHEAALAAVGIRRDYRDYYGRHGGAGFVSAYLNDNASVAVSYGSEQWESRAERHPWSLFRGGEPWRPNPAVDEGRARLLTGSLRIDSRNQTYSPGAGWFVQGDIERGTFEPQFGATPAGPAERATRVYTRGFVDVRRYNRLAPGAQLNVRAVLGGWMNGDQLPLERRLSVGGPMTLPGFDFRKYAGGAPDRLQCSEGTNPATGLAALCDRIALFQIEYRGDLSWHRRNDDDRHWWSDAVHTPTWLVFADAGRGWRAHADGVTAYPIESFPAFSSFKTDIGMGLDFGSASISLAKSASDRTEPVNVIVRLNRRF